MGERFKELPTPHLSFTALFIKKQTNTKQNKPIKNIKKKDKSPT
jgi:hypothetical protein